MTRHAQVLIAISPTRRVTFLNHVETMAIARTMILNLTDIFAYVYRTSMALNVNSIIDLVNQTLVGTAVDNIHFSASKERVSSF